MQLMNLPSQRLVYVGSIDDKVVAYQKIANPEQQLLHTLFFSALLGHPLVLNDGYLLHSAWGRRQLTDENSAVRQMNRQGHLLLAARSNKPYSEWIGEQGERTESYRKLRAACGQQELEKLDEAWKSCVATPWPVLNQQETMLKLLRLNARELLSEEIASEKLTRHWGLFEKHLARESVRTAWENAMLEEQAGFDKREQRLLMGVANEAYHASFACGLSAANGEAQVGVASLGHRVLGGKGAYREQEGRSLSALLASERFERSREVLTSLATVYVMRQESDLFGGMRMAGFIREYSALKVAYRESLKRLMATEEPKQEDVDAFENALTQYREAIQQAFGVKERQAVALLFNLIDKGHEVFDQRREQVDIAVKLLGTVGENMPIATMEWTRAIGNLWQYSSPLIEAGLPAITSTYMTLRLRSAESVELFPLKQQSAPTQDRRAYELALDEGFVRDTNDGIAEFVPAAS